MLCFGSKIVDWEVKHQLKNTNIRVCILSVATISDLSALLIYRVNLLFDVNTKYISSSVLKTSDFSQVCHYLLYVKIEKELLRNDSYEMD